MPTEAHDSSQTRLRCFADQTLVGVPWQIIRDGMHALVEICLE